MVEGKGLVRRGGLDDKVGRWYRRSWQWPHAGQCSLGGELSETATPYHSLNYEILLPISQCVGHIFALKLKWTSKF